MRISDWSSDVCSSDLSSLRAARDGGAGRNRRQRTRSAAHDRCGASALAVRDQRSSRKRPCGGISCSATVTRSEEHTSELQSLMRISYAVFCLKKKKNKNQH